MKNGFLKFLGGAVLGAGVAIAVNNFMCSEKGRRAKQKMRELAEQFYMHIEPKLRAMRMLDPKEFKVSLMMAAKEFCKKHGIPPHKAHDLLRQTQRLWYGMAEEEGKE